MQNLNVYDHDDEVKDSIKSDQNLRINLFQYHQSIQLGRHFHENPFLG